MLNRKLVKITYFVTFSFQIFSANCPLHIVELNQTRQNFSSSVLFVHLVWKIVFWLYRPKNPNFKFQFQAFSNKIGRDKNLARFIELDRVERANDKNVRHTWDIIREHFFILKFCCSKLINIPEWVKQ